MRLWRRLVDEFDGAYCLFVGVDEGEAGA